MKAFFKWAGGKQRLAKEIVSYFPNDLEGNYFEPFLGAGSVFLEAFKKYGEIKKYYLSDLNKNLIYAWELVKNVYADDFLILNLEKYKKFTREEYYKKFDEMELLSKKYKKTQEEQDLLGLFFIHALNFCYIGTWGKNREFPPFFKVDRTIDYKNIEDIRNIIKVSNVNIMGCSYENIFSQIQKKDFIYFDPPYMREKSSYKISYTKEFDSFKFFDFVKGLDCRWVMSNSKNSMILEAFKGYEIEEIESRRSLGNAVTKGKDKRLIKTELLIKNF